MEIEEYVPLGDTRRVVRFYDSSPDMTVSGASDIVRSLDVPESDQVGHAPFFATYVEAAVCTQWVTVADLPWAEDETIYLLAGWVNGLLALKFSEEDVGERYDTNDAHAGIWAMSIVHRDDVEAVLGSSVNLHGLSCLNIGFYSRWGQDTDRETSFGIEYIYIYFKAGLVFFRHFSYAEFGTIEASYDSADVVPFTWLPSLYSTASGNFLNGGTISEEDVQAFDNFRGLRFQHPTWDDYIYYYETDDVYSPELVAYYYQARTVGDYYVTEGFALNVRRWDHCEHLHCWGISARYNTTLGSGEGSSSSVSIAGAEEWEEDEDSGGSSGGTSGGDSGGDSGDSGDGGTSGGTTEWPQSFGYVIGTGFTQTALKKGKVSGETVYRHLITPDSTYLTSLLTNLTASGEVSYNADHTFPGANVDVEMGIQRASAQVADMALSGILTLEFAGSDGDDASLKWQGVAVEWVASPTVLDTQEKTLRTDEQYISTAYINVTPTSAPADATYEADTWYEVTLNATAYKAAALAKFKAVLSALTVSASDTSTSNDETLTATASGTALALTVTVS